jgi:predicted Zn-dependent peptidase
MMLLTNILGGPALNSRLNLSVREKYGYSYTIESSYTTYKDSGFWNVYFGTDSKNLKKTLKLVYREIQTLLEKTISVSYLKMAKEQYKGHLALGMESNAGLMMSLGKSVLFFGQIDTVKEISDSLDRLTSEDLQAIAKKYMSLDQISELVFDISPDK